MVGRLQIAGLRLRIGDGIEHRAQSKAGREVGRDG